MSIPPKVPPKIPLSPVLAPQSDPQPSPQPVPQQEPTEPPQYGLRHSHVLSTGSTAQLDPARPVPSTLYLSAFADDRASLRPYEILALEAPTWHMLLRALMWHGHSRIEPDMRDIQASEECNFSASPAVSFHRDDSGYRVRLCLTLLHSPPPTSSNGRRYSNSSNSDSGRPVRLSRSGISRMTLLPYTVPVPFMTVPLPLSFSELALLLQPFGQMCHYVAYHGHLPQSVSPQPSHMDSMTLRELGESFHFVSRQNHRDQEEMFAPMSPSQLVPSEVTSSFSSSSSSSSSHRFHLNLKSRVKESVRKLQINTDAGVEINPNRNYNQNQSFDNDTGVSLNAKQSPLSSSLPENATYITPFKLDDYA